MANPLGKKSVAALPLDAFSQPIQINSKFKTADATGTPVASPAAITTGAVSTLTVPADAVQLTFCATQDMRVSEVAGMAQYFVVPKGTVFSMGCTNLAAVYFKADSSNGSLSFMFAQLDS